MVIITNYPDMNECFSKYGSVLVVKLKNGKKQCYDFSTDTVYGVTGKPVKTFCGEAKRYLSLYHEKDFLIQYLYNKFISLGFGFLLFEDDGKLVEQIYTIYNDVATIEQLYDIYGFFCCNSEYKIDTKTCSIINQLLYKMKNFNKNLILEKVMNIPEELSVIFQSLSKEYQRVMSKEKDSIMIAYYKNINNWRKRVYNFPYIFTAYLAYCEENHLPHDYNNMIKIYDEVINNDKI